MIWRNGWKRHARPLRRVWLRRAAAACAVAALTVPVGACSSPFALPTSGDVQTLDPVEQQDKRVYTTPDGPQLDAQPEGIVSGFFNAMPAGVQNDGYRVAREFLSADGVASWNGDKAATIYVGTPEFTRALHTSDTAGSQGGGVTIEVTLRVAGRLDSHGLFTAEDDAQEVTLDYTLAKEDGQWRIVKLPQGVVISDSDFEQVYRQVSVYRVDASHSVLIPDVRWLGWRNWRTLAVREALDAPADWLAGAAVDLNGGRVSLAVNTVPLTDNDVQVQLGSAFESLSDDTRALMVRLIRLTLGDGNAEYGNVRVLVNGNSDYSDADRDLTLAVAQESSPIYSLSAGNIVLLSSSSPLRVGQTAGFDDARGFVFTADGGAVLRADHVVECLKSDGSSCGELFEGRRMSTIVKGLGGEIWAVDESRTGLYVSRDGVGSRVAVPWLDDDATIRSLAVSMEGGRMALALDSGMTAGVVFSGIVRADDGRPDRLSEACDRISANADAAMMTFYNDTMLVFATDGDGDAGQSAYRQIAPGPNEAQKLPSDEVTALASGQISSYRRLATLDDLGMVRSVRGSLDGAWSVADSQVTALSAQ